MDAIMLLKDGGNVEYLVFFPHALKANGQRLEHTWSYQLNWPGFWDKLRRDGADYFHAQLTCRSSRLHVKLIFPYGANHVPTKFKKLCPRWYPTLDAERQRPCRPRCG